MATLIFCFEFVMNKDCASHLWCILNAGYDSFSRCLSFISGFFQTYILKLKWRLHHAPCAHLRLSSAFQVHAVQSHLLSSFRVYWGVPFVSLFSLSSVDNLPVMPCSFSLGFISLRCIHSLRSFIH